MTVAPFTSEQKDYLEGLFAGARARGRAFTDVEPDPAAAKPLIKEERIKKELHPLDGYQQLLEDAEANKAPDAENAFRFKWHGLFYLTPNKDAYMARLRIPGGRLKAYQLREIGRAAQELTTGYIQVTTRANLQIRLIEPKNAPELLHRIQGVGLHTRGSGADNIRNLTANPTFGIDPHELIDVSPFVDQLAQIIISSREFYDLPRKFNIAFDGSGIIGCAEDTNDIGLRAVLHGDGVAFRVALGGATGHKAFARDLGVLVPPAKLVKVVVELIRVFIANGNRGNRKAARLKHLLDSWTLERYLEETEKLLGHGLERSAPEAAPTSSEKPHSHIGVYPQKQAGLNYIGIALPIGQLAPKHLLRLADLAENYGGGEVRLTVWQNIILPHIPDAYVETVKKALVKMGFHWQQSHLRSGLIACTGNSYCKYASSNTKGHAAALADYLEKKLSLDQPINIHLTGCPHSCAQHYMGDIGLLGTKAKLAGESVEGYHVFVGGGFGAHQAVGRQIFTAIAFEDLKPTLEKMLRGYLRRREPGETFQSFSQRHDLNDLQAIFTNEE